MNPCLLSDIDVQITCIQEALSLSFGFKEQIVKLQDEKKEMSEKCDNLLAQIESLKNTKCLNCCSLVNQLNKERKEKAMLKKEQKRKLLKAIAKTLESIDDLNTNHMNHQVLTQFICNGLDDSTESRKDHKMVQLLNDSDASEDESGSNILVNETVLGTESEESSNDCNAKQAPLLVVPETEPTTTDLLEARKNQLFKLNEHQSSRNQNFACLKENRDHLEGKDEMQPLAKRLKFSIQSSRLSNVNPKENLETSSHRPLQVNIEKAVERSPSVLSEIIELAAGRAISPRSIGTISTYEEKATCWKMKPGSILLDSSSSNATGKKLKQLTLSVACPEKKHDISLSQTFKGGVASAQQNQKDDEKDVVMPSPERFIRRGFTRKEEPCEMLEDSDVTIFHPAATSTCLPVNNSFDRLPETTNSPPYKYRRDVVRKREERRRLPGQDCDQCARYYEAAGGKPSDVRTRMNACSRHRDKYQIRANTPPGFWDPVFSSTPEDDHQSKP